MPFKVEESRDDLLLVGGFLSISFRPVSSSISFCRLRRNRSFLPTDEDLDRRGGSLDVGIRSF